MASGEEAVTAVRKVTLRVAGVSNFIIIRVKLAGLGLSPRMA